MLIKGYVKDSALIENIHKCVRYKLAAHAATREIEVLQELPKTKVSGKMLRRELKALKL